MTKIKTSTITGEKLAEWTARAQKWKKQNGSRWFNEPQNQLIYVDSNKNFKCSVDGYRPDIYAGQAMELAKKFRLVVNFEIGEVWKCGRTYPIGEDYSAICRAVVGSVFGEEVDDETC